MSLSWNQRKTRLASLLKTETADDDGEGLALDRLMHGQSVIGKTSKTTELEALRFKNRDLDVVGTLEYGQFGVIDVVTCRFDNCVYVRKSVQKKFALRTRDQCSPQFERNVLLQALKTNTPWVPHLLCAFQTPTHLSLVMDYAEGGTLWDVLESSPHDGRILESDLRWWIPQIVSAIHWCHSQGFAHRDIKPHNFVLTPDSHIQLIDFGTAAPLLPPNADGVQLIPKQYCLVPCGTCDYISPEILQAHEEALVALEMDDEDDDIVKFGKPQQSEGYGVETDWWSLGAMLYEMAYGAAPFFANDIKQTYLRIVNHEKSLRFDQKVDISHEYQHFIRRLLTNANQRLGRRNVMEITDHPLFDSVNWTTLSSEPAPSNLHLPQFTYMEPKPPAPSDPLPDPTHEDTSSYSQGFAFSAFFQPSSSVSPGLSILRPSPKPSGGPSPFLNNSNSPVWQNLSNSASSFIGFSWGPHIDAFPEEAATGDLQGSQSSKGSQPTPRPLIRTPLRSQHLVEQGTPVPVPSSEHPNQNLSVPFTWGPGNLGPLSTPGKFHAYTTPVKPYAQSPYATLPRTSTIRRTAPRRNVSDREAMKQLVDCVGMSARKKVLESGRKPKILNIFDSKNNTSGGGGGGRSSAGGGNTLKMKGSNGTLRKELRFDKFAMPIPRPDYSGASSHVRSRSNSRSLTELKPKLMDLDGDDNEGEDDMDTDMDMYLPQEQHHRDRDRERYYSSDTSDSEGDGPPSPSPSPRPGSAMSMISMSRRSVTPTVSGYFNATGTGTFLSGSALARKRSGSGSLLVPVGDRSVTGTMSNTTNTNMGTTTTTISSSSGLLSVPPSAVNTNFKIGKPPAATSKSVSRKRGIEVDPETEATSMSEEDDIVIRDKRATRRRSREDRQRVEQPPLPSLLSAVAQNHRQTQGHRRRHSEKDKEKEGPVQASASSSSSARWRFDDLETRHAAIMQDIENLERKFFKVSRVVSN